MDWDRIQVIRADRQDITRMLCRRPDARISWLAYQVSALRQLYGPFERQQSELALPYLPKGFLRNRLFR